MECSGGEISRPEAGPAGCQQVKQRLNPVEHRDGGAGVSAMNCSDWRRGWSTAHVGWGALGQGKAFKLYIKCKGSPLPSFLLYATPGPPPHRPL